MARYFEWARILQSGYYLYNRGFIGDAVMHDIIRSVMKSMRLLVRDDIDLCALLEHFVQHGCGDSYLEYVHFLKKSDTESRKALAVKDSLLCPYETLDQEAEMDGFVDDLSDSTVQ